MALSLRSAGIKPVSRELIPIRVLVVDDEALIRWSICSALGAAGFDAVAARSGEDACQLASEWPPPKVALLDIPPDGTGRELMSRIRDIYPDCRFVVMTTARRGLAGVDPSGIQTVEKPFDMREIVRVVRDAIEQQT